MSNQILACDMAGPGFDYIYKKDPKGAAKNVQCIHTSMAGTAERNCHQVSFDKALHANELLFDSNKYRIG